MESLDYLELKEKEDAKEKWVHKVQEDCQVLLEMQENVDLEECVVLLDLKVLLESPVLLVAEECLGQMVQQVQKVKMGTGE